MTSGNGNLAPVLGDLARRIQDEHQQVETQFAGGAGGGVTMPRVRATP